MILLPLRFDCARPGGRLASPQAAPCRRARCESACMAAARALVAGLLAALVTGAAPAARAQSGPARPYSPLQATAIKAADAAVPRQWDERPLAGRIDLGQPRVLSQRGQRLKVAVPYGAAPDEPVSASRIWVADASAAPGDRPLSADDFVVLKPEHRNVVVLQSQHPVTASRVMLTLRVAGQDDASTYDLAVPPVQFAPIESASRAQTAPPATRRAAGAERRRQRAAPPAAARPSK